MRSPAIAIALPGNYALAEALRAAGAEPGVLETRRFPDDELYLRVRTPVRDRTVVLACTLDRPDKKLVMLYQLATTLRELGARRIILAAPYLAYMRQDQAFNEGEAVNARHVAKWISSFVDGLVTVDPHLHRIGQLKDVFSIRAEALGTGAAVAAWIRDEIEAPFLVGPDSESEQWVSRVAARVGCDYCVLEKTRLGDHSVSVSVPGKALELRGTPVLVDDIISTGRTLVETLRHLRHAGLPGAVCVATHAVFAGNAYEELRAAGARRIVTCNTIPHASNAIDLNGEVARAALEI